MSLVCTRCGVNIVQRVGLECKGHPSGTHNWEEISNPKYECNRLHEGALNSFLTTLPTIEFWHAGLGGSHAKLTRPNGTTEFNTRIQDVPVSMIGKRFALVELNP